jgi:hypothetical protein
MVMTIPHDRHLRNSFPLGQGAAHGGSIKGDAAMRTQHSTALPATGWSLPQPIAAVWNRLFRPAPRAAPAAILPASPLPVSLRGELGAADGRFAEMPEPLTLETIWLRHYR